jgi:hypothetical protein
MRATPPSPIKRLLAVGGRERERERERERRSGILAFAR